MKNFANKLAAVLAAAVMTVSAAGISVSADTETDTPKYTGWSSDEYGWQYLSEGVPCASDSRLINGVYYRFSLNGYCTGTCTGWSKTGKCYYQNGQPHTGWIGDDGSKQYCLDGYPVTGNFQIGDRLYSFDKNGIYTGKSTPAVLTASCGESISADAEKISITVKYNDGNDNISYTIGEPAKMERWENGKWKRCGKPSQYAVDDIAYELGGLGDCSVNSTDVAFYSHRYMGGDMPEGYYRVIVPVSYGETKKDLYAVFRAVPPVEVKMSEDIYIANNARNTTVGINIDINSKKDTLKAEKIIGDIKLEVQQKTESGWETCENFGYAAGYPDKENKLEISGEFFPGTGYTGYYRTLLTVGGKEYTAPFRIDNIWATPWLDSYSLKSNDITVSFTVRNKFDKSVKIGTDLINLYKKENNEWNYMQDTAGRFDCVEIDPSYITLEAGHKTTLSFDLSEYYDTSKLTEGDYAVLIDGAGFAEFKLTNDEPSAKEFPFKDLKSEDIKEIQLRYTNASMDVTTVIRGGNGRITNTVGEEDQYGITKATAVVKSDEQLKRVIDYLRQFKLGEPYRKNDTYCGGTTRIIVRYKNNTKKTLDFEYSKAVAYNGKSKYYCDEMLYFIADDMIEDTNKEYYASLGYNKKS
ncbi:MAG: hypothetical protein K2J11_07490 [Oscillospiraceae bacterium]|nr:hypothetical protein [Oscillospiraceae bacterium]